MTGSSERKSGNSPARPASSPTVEEIREHLRCLRNIAAGAEVFRGKREVFRREGEHWVVEHGGRILRTGDSPGLRYLASLAGHPGREIPAVALYQGAHERAVDPNPARASRHVARAVWTALERISRLDPPLGDSLARVVRIGPVCSFEGEPASRQGDDPDDRNASHRRT